MLVNGDKIVAKKDVLNVISKGDICKVVDVEENGLVSFAFGNGFVHKGVMTTSECEEYFEKYEEPKLPNRVTKERIEEILDESNVWTTTVFDKCTIVACQLPNGFVITESSACVSPENYDEDMGFDICIEKIADKIWELEAYKLQQDLYDIGYCDEVEVDYDLHLELEDEDGDKCNACIGRDCEEYRECECEFRK